MATFFSGTDLATLKEEGTDRNHFVSLIVNNEGKYTAAITRKIYSTKNITEEITYKSFDDIEKKSKNSYDITSCEIEYSYLNIEFETPEFNNEELSLRLNTLYETKKKRETLDSVAKPSLVSQQGFLFSNKEKTNKYKSDISSSKTVISNKPKAHIEDNEEESIPYEYIRFDSKIIKSVVIQLITGSVILTDKSKVDINKWMSKMVNIFEGRFGKGDMGFKSFKNWADSYIDYIVWYTDDDSLINMGYTDDELAAICAYDLIEELEKLPSNIYIKAYIDILTDYII